MGPYVPTFQEFKAATFQDVGGQYVVNGDETIASSNELRDYYEQMVNSRDTDSQSLVVNTVGGLQAWQAYGYDVVTDSGAPGIVA